MKFLLSCVFLMISGQFANAAFPEKPIRLVVPFATGGTSEIVARSIATGLTSQLGQSVYVDNKPGGAGNIAMEEVKGAAPNGYTLILGHVGTLAVNPALFGKKLPYDPNKDFLPITFPIMVIVAALVAGPAINKNNLPKNPAVGGTPAKENKAMVNTHDNMGLVL